MALSIEPARTEEARALTEIAHRAKAHWGYPETWIAAWRTELTLTPEYLARADVWVARQDDVPTGFYALAPPAPAAEGDSLELDHLWVRPEAMGRGIGRALVRHAAKRAAQRGFGTLFILSDPHAESFYQAMGAATTGRRAAFMDTEKRWLPEMALPTKTG